MQSVRVQILVLMFAISPASTSARQPPEPGKHLFVLSGQSNMTGGVRDGFLEAVEREFGAKNVAVVHHCKSGRGIRFWDRDYRFPNEYQVPGKGPPSERSKKQHGEVYPALISKAREAKHKQTFDTVTLVWMQGESDGARGLGEVYEQSFLRLFARLRSDLDTPDMYFVIGRINRARLNGEFANQWQKVRRVQVKLADDAPRGAWINTDDLSRPEDGVHFPKENYPVLGKRFAASAAQLIRRNDAEPRKDNPLKVDSK